MASLDDALAAQRRQSDDFERRRQQEARDEIEAMMRGAALLRERSIPTSGVYVEYWQRKSLPWFVGNGYETKDKLIRSVRVASGWHLGCYHEFGDPETHYLLTDGRLTGGSGVPHIRVENGDPRSPDDILLQSIIVPPGDFWASLHVEALARFLIGAGIR
jgi:hypothetical protein